MTKLEEFMAVLIYTLSLLVGMSVALSCLAPEKAIIAASVCVGMGIGPLTLVCWLKAAAWINRGVHGKPLALTNK